MRAHWKMAFCAAGLLAVGGGWWRLAYEGSAGTMSKAGEAFVASLSAEQREKAVMPFDSPKRLDWHFIPKDSRKGLQLKDMTDAQRKAAMALLQSGVSEVGAGKAETIMASEMILKSLQKKETPVRDPQRYYFTVFGQPEATGRWGWSVEGHHLSLNFTVEDGRLLSSTPTFFGANPAEIKTEVAGAPKVGTRLLRKEEQLGFDLYNSLTEDQIKIALLAAKAPADIRGPADQQPPKAAAEGLPAASMTDEQVKTLKALITAYTENMPKDVAEYRWLAIDKAGFEKIHFAWAGAGKSGVGHYYRVQGPSFLIEFNNTQPDLAGNIANHIHSVWRNTAGDFGVEQ